MSADAQTKPYDTSYNRLKCVLALIILRNKPVDWKIEEYIQFVNCNDLQQKKMNEITQIVKEQTCDNNNRVKQNDQEVIDNKNIIVDESNISRDGQLRWRKRALELANDVESLKQQICIVKLELENTKQNIMTNKRRKTKSQVIPAVSGAEGDNITPSAQSRKYQDPDCQVFQEIPEADNEAWRQFDVNQAMSFLQKIKLIMPGAPTISSSTNSGVMITQTVIKIIRYMSIKLTSLLGVFQTNPSKSNNLKQTYSTCVNSFGTVLRKLIAFLESPLLSTSEKNEIISAIATSFASLVKAIHILTTLNIEELVRESNETKDIINESLKISSEIQDPRDVITCVLTHICNEIEPKLKEAVCFVAAKECLRLIIKEFNTNKDSAPEGTNSSISNIGSISSIGGTLYGETCSETVSNLLSKNEVKIKSIACKDTTYYLLLIIEEILVNNQGYKLDNEVLSEEAIKNINTLLEASILNNKQTSAHGDSFTMYLCNICEKLWIQLGNVSFTNLLEKVI